MTGRDPSVQALAGASGEACADVSEAMIAALVDAFYEQARADPTLGPIFRRVIGADDEAAHIARVREFWSAEMLGAGRPAAELARSKLLHAFEEPRR